jgi:hypothetical protein
MTFHFNLCLQLRIDTRVYLFYDSTMLFLLIKSLLAQPSGQDIKTAIVHFNQHSYYNVPVLSSAQTQELLNGNTLSIIDQQAGESGAKRAIGMRLSDQPKEKLWISCQDPHFVQQSSTKELRVEFTEPDVAKWYGYLDLPWPFADRHWYVKVWNNHDIAKKTQNQAWEHPWELIANGGSQVRPQITQGKLTGITPDMMDEAIYTPLNKGAWAVVSVNDGSLLIYHATTRVGGNIPEDAIVQFVKSGLDDMLRAIEERAQNEISTHYRGSHPLLPGGDGKPVQHF